MEQEFIFLTNVLNLNPVGWRLNTHTQLWILKLYCKPLPLSPMMWSVANNAAVMFTSHFKALYISVSVSILYVMLSLFPIGAFGLWRQANNAGCQRTQQMCIWGVCDVANDSSIATVWGHMLSLITTEHSGLVLINSTDVTIRKPQCKDKWKCSGFFRTHATGASCQQPGQRSSREQSCAVTELTSRTHCYSINYKHCYLMKV